MPRFRLTVEYDGTPFSGWQRQANGPSVQAALEDAVAAFAGERIAVTGAGRTDAGVHALGQVAHLDLPDGRFDGERLRMAANHHLRPLPVTVLAASAVADGFHARFDADRRIYRYRILNRPSPPSLLRDRVWFVPRPLDAAAMQGAAAELLGRHDFTSFRAAGCQARSPVRTLDRLCVARAGEEIRVTAVARSFLHRQVRAIVGTLKLVGEGRWRAGDVRAALAARDRSAAGPSAPACGLYLVAVRYGACAQTPDTRSSRF